MHRFISASMCSEPVNHRNTNFNPVSLRCIQTCNCKEAVSALNRAAKQQPLPFNYNLMTPFVYTRTYRVVNDTLTTETLCNVNTSPDAYNTKHRNPDVINIQVFSHLQLYRM